jgi:hypothetical protein
MPSLFDDDKHQDRTPEPPPTIENEEVVTTAVKVLFLEFTSKGDHLIQELRDAVRLWEKETANFKKDIEYQLVNFKKEIGRLNGAHQVLVNETEVRLDHVVDKAQTTATGALRSVFEELIETIASDVAENVKNETVANFKEVLELLQKDLGLITVEHQKKTALILQSIDKGRNNLDTVSSKIQNASELAVRKIEEAANWVAETWKKRLIIQSIVIFCTGIVTIIASCWIMGHATWMYPPETQRLIQGGQYLDSFYYKLPKDEQHRLMELSGRG